MTSQTRGRGGQLLAGEVVGPGALDLHGLVVVGDVGKGGAGGLGFAQVIQSELGLLASLVFGQRLGEEIGAHLDAHLPGTNGVLEEKLVGGKRAFRGASVADAGESELHAASATAAQSMSLPWCSDTSMPQREQSASFS